MLTITSKEDLFAAMARGATLITPNNRLSNQLLHDFFKQRNVGVLDKPRCLPYQAFLRILFKQACHRYPNTAQPILLTQQQQRYLWQQIISTTQERCHEGLLHAVQEAWTRCQLWLIDNNDEAFLQTPQTRQFQQWQHQFQQQLKKKGAITEEQLASHLLDYPEFFALKEVVWVCFDDFTPTQERLRQTIQTQDGQQYDYDLAPHPTLTHRYPANDQHDECLQMIHWLKHKLALGEQRIGVVVPELEAQSHHLQRLLQRHLPENLFNISLGQPLATYPLVAHALSWLTLEKQTISNHQARLLLHSPYLKGAQAEFNARTEVMQNNTVLQELNLPVVAFIDALKHSAPKLAELLSNLSDYPETASPANWVTHFKTRLSDLGFPGEYPLHSSAYQCFQRLMMLFDELLPFAVVNPLMSRSDALDTLQQLAKSTIFQAQKSTTPIQILGLLEASGCTFDSLWMCGLTDQCLPQKTKLSAFIPLDMQREHKMPRAIPARELQFAEQLLQRLQRGSRDTVFSYPCLTGDTPNLPSPLISHFPVLAVNSVATVATTSLLISHEESYQLPLLSTEAVSGGTGLLANQAKCPFRAFAAHRLHAKPGLDITDGPDASERGQIMHRIMDLLWQRLGSQQNLLSLSQEALDETVLSAITKALEPLVSAQRPSFPKLVQRVELSRLQRLVTACLDWEKQRQPFVVEAIEQAFTIQLAGLDFRVRVDRLDKISDGDKKWVIDYKSSLPSSKPWNEERPEAPQLLLYALLDDSINALLFLQLKTGRLTCSGLSEDKLPVEGLSTLKKEERWSDRQQQWRQQLTELAQEFREGHCPPQPTRNSTCQQCDFPHLCRVSV